MNTIFEKQISECNTNTEYKIDYVMSQIENNNSKVREIDNNCKIEFKTIHNTISDLECDNNIKLMNVKNELSKAISQQVNTVTDVYKRQHLYSAAIEYSGL